jgi:hypothetical protein
MCVTRVADKDVPRQYQTYVESLDIDGSGYISLTAVHRLLSSSGLSATVVEQVSLPSIRNPEGNVLANHPIFIVVQIISSVVNPSEPSVTKQQAFVVFGLAGLAQNGQGTSL